MKETPKRSISIVKDLPSQREINFANEISGVSSDEDSTILPKMKKIVCPKSSKKDIFISSKSRVLGNSSSFTEQEQSKACNEEHSIDSSIPKQCPHKNNFSDFLGPESGVQLSVLQTNSNIGKGECKIGQNLLSF